MFDIIYLPQSTGISMGSTFYPPWLAVDKAALAGVFSLWDVQLLLAEPWKMKDRYTRE